MKNIMLDLETLGNGNNAAIIAIGACAFELPDDGKAMDTFYERVDPESSVAGGMKMDVSTVLWWMQQSDAARKSTFEGKTISLHDALQQFSAWVGGDCPVWGNGATFDNVIIRSAFAAVGLSVPWKFWNDRCYRTMKSLVSFKAEPMGIAHNALDDALGQAIHLQKIYAALGLK